MRALPCVAAFQKSPDGNKVKTERSTTIYEVQKIMNKETPLNVLTLKLSLLMMNGVHHMIEFYKIQLLWKKWWELHHVSGFSVKSRRKPSPLVINYYYKQICHSGHSQLVLCKDHFVQVASESIELCTQSLHFYIAYWVLTMTSNGLSLTFDHKVLKTPNLSHSMIISFKLH